MPTTHTVNLELMTFVEREILPRYNAFDRAHNLTHALSVIRRSLALARAKGVDSNMAYVVAAYHDLGMEGPRAIHHLTSGKILASDQRLHRWFSPQQIDMMRQAVEDHRASASHKPRNVFGLIVAEADRDLSPDVVCRRIVEYGIDHYPEKTEEEHFERFADHLKNKYGPNGYIRLWVRDKVNDAHLAELRALMADSERLRETFNSLWAQLHNDNTSSQSS
ncbi:MAG: HD domain-containing protein [Bacteroidaceae bacterium]|nr:HD domain-containing protein [Bacteroidaceae bacterium]